jgi:hypothetical protein
MSSSVEVSEARKVVQELIVRTQGWQCCLNCLDWDKANERCDKFNARPPAAIIVVGCKDHTNDIPF